MSNGLTKEELIKLVEKICNVEGTEDEMDNMLRVLEENVLHPAVSDLIFYNDDELTPKEIVEKALSYKQLT
ncbi:hypothetical protein BKP45_08685 [Anaerobacillus alkalidiazotrophicus]|uniref:E9imm peptide n=1 Tax=Anaerobacillus alkalidiazotrophicus TaxID=472963 RepID=A0A1S2M7U7_9BACI|nr:hypothetical protein BKP45_08685 [Anaerobacillus alkalidiazotrophicus]